MQVSPPSSDYSGWRISDFVDAEISLIGFRQLHRNPPKTEGPFLNYGMRLVLDDGRVRAIILTREELEAIVLAGQLALAEGDPAGGS